MQPRPTAETSRLLFPSVRFCIVTSMKNGLLIEDLPESAIREFENGFGQARALHVNLTGGLIDVADVARSEFDIRCSQVFLKSVQLGSSGNRHDPPLLCEQPRECNLRRSGMLLLCHAL